MQINTNLMAPFWGLLPVPSIYPNNKCVLEIAPLEMLSGPDSVKRSRNQANHTDLSKPSTKLIQNYPKMIFQIVLVFTYSEANANPKFWKLTKQPW